MAMVFVVVVVRGGGDDSNRVLYAVVLCLGRRWVLAPQRRLVCERRFQRPWWDDREIENEKKEVKSERYDSYLKEKRQRCMHALWSPCKPRFGINEQS